MSSEVDRINNQLKDLFGIDTVTGLQIFRIVYSEDQLEKRYGTYDDYTKGGLYIRTVTEVREVPKYRQWIQKRPAPTKPPFFSMENSLLPIQKS